MIDKFGNAEVTFTTVTCISFNVSISFLFCFFATFSILHRHNLDRQAMLFARQPKLRRRLGAPLFKEMPSLYFNAVFQKGILESRE